MSDVKLIDTQQVVRLVSNAGTVLLGTASAGTAGKSAYQIWLDAGNTGTAEEFLASLVGKVGLRHGPLPLPDDLAPGDLYLDTDQGVVYRKTEGGVDLLFQMSGSQGPQGLNAYDVWRIVTGNTNATPQEYLDAQIGAQGPQGDPGPPGSGLPYGGTAYQVLLKNSDTDQDAGWYTSYDVPGAGAPGQVLQKNTSGDGDYSWRTIGPSGLGADLAINTSPAAVVSRNLAEAGRYRISFDALFRGTSIAAHHTLTVTCAHTGTLLELQGSWTRVLRDSIIDEGSTYGGTTLLASRGSVGEIHHLRFVGHVVVAAAGTLSLSAAVDAGTGVLAPGTQFQVWHESVSTTLQGYPNYVTLLSGVGYAGSVLTSTSPGQWTADGVTIVGQTGSTYTILRADEGKALRCGNSNAFQMWTPLLLPTSYKTNGTNFGGWWDPSDSASVTVDGSTNVSAIANQFSGGPAQVQVTANLRPAYSAGQLNYGTGTSLSGFGLRSAATVLLGYCAHVLQYKNGTETTTSTQWSYIVSEPANAAGQAALNGNSGNQNNLATGGEFGMKNACINAGEISNATIIPLPMGIVEAANATAILRLFGPCSSGANTAWRGTMREWIYLTHTPPRGPRTRLQGYLAWHNGIQGVLPPDHPYAAMPPRVS